jgi:hypothetical protein
VLRAAVGDLRARVCATAEIVRATCLTSSAATVDGGRSAASRWRGAVLLGDEVKAKPRAQAPLLTASTQHAAPHGAREPDAPCRVCVVGRALPTPRR